jgi:hypothetical protein
MASSVYQGLEKHSSTQSSVFLTSCNALEATLSEHQHHTFANGDVKQALEAARRLNEDNRNDSRFRSSMDAINHWIAGVQRYFTVVDTLVSAKPEAAALIWGGVRFLIEVRLTCSLEGDTANINWWQTVRQYNDFLDKLTSITKAMTGDLEIYQDYTKLYSDSSSVQEVRLVFSTFAIHAQWDVKALFLVYGDILKLCTVVYSAFINKKGKKRRASTESHSTVLHFLSSIFRRFRSLPQGLGITRPAAVGRRDRLPRPSAGGREVCGPF